MTNIVFSLYLFLFTTIFPLVVVFWIFIFLRMELASKRSADNNKAILYKNGKEKEN